jgi:hypothetical protein
MGKRDMTPEERARDAAIYAANHEKRFAAVCGSLVETLTFQDRLILAHYVLLSLKAEAHEILIQKARAA